MAQRSSKINGYGCISMHEGTILEKMKYLIFTLLGALVLYLIYINYMIRTYPAYFFGP